MNARILVIDDDVALAEMIGIVLKSDGYDSAFCEDGARALEVFRREKPDLVLLDVMLPGLDGIEICKLIRHESDVPIVMLTARSDTLDVVAGLEAGADDYVAKPFKPKELIARIKTRLRRQEEPLQERFRVGDIEIDVAAHLVTRGSETLALTPLEFDLLLVLARNPHKVFSRTELLEQVWGYRHSADTRLVNVHIQRLRAKVERDPESPSIITTVRGIGYRAGDAL